MIKKILLVLLITGIFYKGYCQQPVTEPSDQATSRCRILWAEMIDRIDTEWETSLNKVLNQKANTSSLLPYIIADFRTYICKLRAVCIDVDYSITEATPNKNINIIGCFKTPRPITPIKECLSRNPEQLRQESEFCNNTVTEKIELGKIFLKSVMRRDAYKKKTGYLVYRYETLIQKIHNKLYDHIRLMVSYFTEFISRSKCYLQQCDIL